MLAKIYKINIQKQGASKKDINKTKQELYDELINIRDLKK